MAKEYIEGMKVTDIGTAKAYLIRKDGSSITKEEIEPELNPIADPDRAERLAADDRRERGVILGDLLGEVESAVFKFGEESDSEINDEEPSNEPVNDPEPVNNDPEPVNNDPEPEPEPEDIPEEDNSNQDDDGPQPDPEIVE